MRSYHSRLSVCLAYSFLLISLLIVFFLILVVTYYRFVYNNILSRSYHTRLRLLLTIIQKFATKRTADNDLPSPLPNISLSLFSGVINLPYLINLIDSIIPTNTSPRPVGYTLVLKHGSIPAPVPPHDHLMNTSHT